LTWFRSNLMTRNELKKILKSVKSGALSVQDAVREMARLPFEDIGFAKVDHHRAIRCGFPEVIFCQGKTPAQVVGIADRVLSRSPVLLVTRADGKIVSALGKKFRKIDHNKLARTVVIRKGRRKLEKLGCVCVVSAGTSDMPVAEEARVTAECMGASVRAMYDVGVAGIHRLLKHHKDLAEANVLVVVAGMEGALASVVGGMVNKPVIGVPTSVGYGASFGGLAALLTMLNSCASNVSVVNIDNGFGAGYIAGLINRLACEKE